MKIAELEADHVACIDAERSIRAMVENREFPAVFSVCVESFPHIVPAIQFRKKREMTPEIPTLLAFTTICRYAPLLFEHAAIESLFEFIKSNRLLAQHENNYLSAIEAARNRENVAHALWNHLETQPGAPARDLGTQLGVTQEDAVKIIDLWEELGRSTGSKKPARFAFFSERGWIQRWRGCATDAVFAAADARRYSLGPLNAEKCGAEGCYCLGSA